MEPHSAEEWSRLLRKIERERAAVEARLQRMASRLGVARWEELGELFEREGLDDPRVDLLWPRYVYLSSRLKELGRRKSLILRTLEGETR